MAPHSSALAWKIPWTEEPGGLQSMGSLRVRHDWATSLSLFTFMHWRRKWQPTAVFLPGESQGWGCTSRTRLKWLSRSRTARVQTHPVQPRLVEPLSTWRPLSMKVNACFVWFWDFLGGYCYAGYCDKSWRMKNTSNKLLRYRLMCSSVTVELLCHRWILIILSKRFEETTCCGKKTFLD